MLPPERARDIEPNFIGLRVDAGSQAQGSSRPEQVLVLHIDDEPGSAAGVIEASVKKTKRLWLRHSDHQIRDLYPLVRCAGFHRLQPNIRGGICPRLRKVFCRLADQSAVGDLALANPELTAGKLRA